MMRAYPTRLVYLVLLAFSSWRFPYDIAVQSERGTNMDRRGVLEMILWDIVS